MAAAALRGADAGMITSFCPDARDAEPLLLTSTARRRVFYDLDAGVTLDRLVRHETVAYLGPRGLRDYDLVLSYTGGASLDQLQSAAGARVVAPLYGSVDPDVHRPVRSDAAVAFDLSYLGTFAADRQGGVDRLFLEPARRRPGRRFILGGSQYPCDFPWTPNIHYRNHVAPEQHPAFYCGSRLTLNVTRGAMAASGFCPSGRLFEAAACGVPILSDDWPGLDTFFAPGTEILVASSTDAVLEALEYTDRELRLLGNAARARALAEHTADHRVVELECLLNEGSRTDVGSDSGGGRRYPNPTARVFEGTAAGRQPS